MSGAPYTLRIKRFLSNPLLERKQFALEILHPERANVSKAELKAKLATMYRVADPNCIILFGLQTAFGGYRSSGFGVIYDNLTACKIFEQRYRLVRNGIAEKPSGGLGRRAKKDIKNRQKKARGTDKAKLASASQKK